MANARGAWTGWRGSCRAAAPPAVPSTFLSAISYALCWTLACNSVNRPAAPCWTPYFKILFGFRDRWQPWECLYFATAGCSPAWAPGFCQDLALRVINVEQIINPTLLCRLMLLRLSAAVTLHRVLLQRAAPPKERTPSGKRPVSPATPVPLQGPPGRQTPKP